MFSFLKEQRKRGQVTNVMLDLYKGVFIDQAQYDELKAITVNAE